MRSYPLIPSLCDSERHPTRCLAALENYAIVAANVLPLDCNDHLYCAILHSLLYYHPNAAIYEGQLYATKFCVSWPASMKIDFHT